MEEEEEEEVVEEEEPYLGGMPRPVQTPPILQLLEVT